jgi:hypothetical protein
VKKPMEPMLLPLREGKFKSSMMKYQKKMKKITTTFNPYGPFKMINVYCS